MAQVARERDLRQPARPIHRNTTGAPQIRGGKVVGATKPKPRTNPIKVQAIELGYYDHKRRREGDVFVIACEEDFSQRWMRKVDPRTRVNEPLDAHSALSDRVQRMNEDNLGISQPDDDDVLGADD